MLLRFIQSRHFFWIFPLALFIASFIQIEWFLHYWWYSALFHFSGGAAMAIVFIHFWETRRKIYFFRDWRWINLILTISFVALIGVVWEFYELGLDRLPIIPIFHPFAAQPGLYDTMADLFFDISGAALVSVLYRIQLSSRAMRVTVGSRSKAVATPAVHRVDSYNEDIREI